MPSRKTALRRVDRDRPDRAGVDVAERRRRGVEGERRRRPDTARST